MQLRPRPPKVFLPPPIRSRRKSTQPTSLLLTSPLSSPHPPSLPPEYRDFCAQTLPFVPCPVRIFADRAIQHSLPESPITVLQRQPSLSGSPSLPCFPLPGDEIEDGQALRHSSFDAYQPVEPSHCSSPTSSENIMEARAQILAEYRSQCRQAMDLRHNRYVPHVPDPDSGELEKFLVLVFLPQCSCLLTLTPSQSCSNSCQRHKGSYT